MIRFSPNASVSLALFAVLGLGCSSGPEPKTAAKGQVETEINRCLGEEAHGEAKGCWTYFLENYSEVASTAERTLAKEHLAHASGPPPARNDDDAVEQAAKSEGLGRRMEQKSGPPPSTDSQSGDGFPPQTVSYEDCYKSISLTGNSERDLATVTAACGAPCGMIPFSDVLSGSLDGEEQKTDSWGIDLRVDRCYRFFAVGDSSIDDLDAAVVDGQGNIVMRDVFPDRAPILGPSGPYCPEQAGQHKFVVAVAKGGGSFKFQVWQGPAQRRANVL